ncbi:MAG: hypothetical protein DI556_09975 [Rhodovulum sulfidophilum]|uniref:Uncharacterized protein n=1 Tax=Rhodovulum sulfidophilum TaxID=35806 RepID=A0A2W5NB70_RHOSU|nr:MAG: hypothetical protein DI556_09975 [Rhodovulum sulfidophilum]
MIRPAGLTLHAQLRDWFAEFGAIGARHGDRPQFELDRLLAAHDELLQPLLRIPSKDPRDALAKYIAEGRDGGFEVGEETHAELRRFSEIEGPLPDDPARAEIAALLGEWFGLQQTDGALKSEDEVTALAERMEETEAQMMAIPSPDLASFCMKLIVGLHGGQTDLSDETKRALLAEASRFTGVDLGEAYVPVQSELSYCLDRWIALNAKAATHDLTESETDEIRNLEHRMVPLQPKTVREAYGKAAVWRGILPYGINGGEHGAFEEGMPAEIARIAGIPFIAQPARIESAEIAVPPGPEPDVSPLRALYHRWQEAKRVYNEATREDFSSEQEALYTLEEQAAAYIPRTIEDYAFKIIIADDDGDMDMNVHQVALVKQAYELVGIEQGSIAPRATLVLDDKIQRLFREYYALLRQAAAYVVPEDLDVDAEMERLFYRRTDAIDKEIAAQPAVSAADFAAKALISHCFGNDSCLRLDGPFWTEARRLTGCPGKPWEVPWGLATVPVALEDAKPVVDETLRLIAEFEAAEDAYNAANRATDSVVTGQERASEAEWAEVDRTSNALDKATVGLCAYASPTLAGSRAKSEFLLGSFFVDGEGSEPVKALLRSIAQMVRFPGGADPDGDREILRLFHERRAILAALPNHPIDTDEEHERLFYGPADVLRDRMMAIPAKTSAGFAAKVIVDTSEGGLFTDWETGELWKEARRLTGTLEPKIDGEASRRWA